MENVGTRDLYAIIVESKFRGMCRDVLTPEQMREALDVLWRLDEMEDAGRIIDLFRV